MQQSNEDARRVSQWLRMALESVGFHITEPIGWQRSGLKALVYVNDKYIGELGTVYTEFRDGTLIARLHQELP